MGSYSVAIISAFLVAAAFAQGNGNDFQNENGYMPGPVNYFTENENRTDEPRSQQPRIGLGFPIGYGTDLQGYNGGVGGLYSPLRIDLGGLVLGTVIGLGAVLIVPKLFHIFTPGHGGYAPHGAYGRSEEVEKDFGSGVSKVLARMDQVLSENNIDSSSCLQRAVCTYVQSYTTPTTLQLINSTAANSLVKFLIEGSKFKEAVERGESGESCATLYPKCQLNLPGTIQSLINNNSI